MKFAILSCTVATATAFAPMSANIAATGLRSSAEDQIEAAPAVMEEMEAAPEVVAPTPINGWVPDESLPCYGLPGALAPTGFFDPIGFSRDGITLNEVKRYRESEIMHGRVAMMATVGYLIGENTPTIAYGFDHPTIANNMIPEVPLFGVMFPFFLIIIFL